MSIAFSELIRATGLYRGTIIRHAYDPIDRDNQETDVIYTVPTGTTSFWTIDGIGRFYYDTVDEAIDDHLNTIDRIVIMHDGFLD